MESNRQNQGKECYLISLCQHWIHKGVARGSLPGVFPWRHKSFPLVVRPLPEPPAATGPRQALKQDSQALPPHTSWFQIFTVICSRYIWKSCFHVVLPKGSVSKSLVKYIISNTSCYIHAFPGFLSYAHKHSIHIIKIEIKGEKSNVSLHMSHSDIFYLDYGLFFLNVRHGLIDTVIECDVISCFVLFNYRSMLLISAASCLGYACVYLISYTSKCKN